MEPFKTFSKNFFIYISRKWNFLIPRLKDFRREIFELKNEIEHSESFFYISEYGTSQPQA